MDWHHHTVSNFLETWHGYIKSDSSDKALIRLQRDDPIWTSPTISYKGIVKEQVVKDKVNFSSKFQVRRFKKGFVVAYEIQP